MGSSRARSNETTSSGALAGRRSRREQRVLTLVGLACSVVALAAACVPPPPTPAPTTTTTTSLFVPWTPPTITPITTSSTTSTTTTLPGTAPVVLSFTTPLASVSVPALVPLAWKVLDPQGTALSCRIDVGDDGVDDVVANPCQGERSRNVTLTATGPTVVRLTVSDGSESSTSTLALTGAAGPTESFDIVMRPQGAIDPTAQTMFAAAEARWESIVVRGVPSTTFSIGTNACGATNGSFSGTVDDLLIDYSTKPIDGPGGILGRAGPCLISGADGLPRFGLMEFDSADLASMISWGVLDEVIVHEMAHVLGYGTVWDSLPSGTLLGGYSSAFPPRFIGPRATAEWSALGGTEGVPVEVNGGPGTANSHWRESTFDNELMTGWIDSGANPLSRVTIASLADIGYRVDVTVADAYSLPTAWAGLSALRAPEVEIETTRLGPIGTV